MYSYLYNFIVTLRVHIDWIKYLGINLPKEAKDLYAENYERYWWKKSKMT